MRTSGRFAPDAGLSGVRHQLLSVRWFRNGLAAPLALLAGCATVSHFGGVTLDDDALYVSGVPPVRQDKDHACGAACVAAVAAHWGVSLADFKSTWPREAGDATGAELQTMARRLGLQAFAYTGSMDDLRENLARGRPVIAMIPIPFVPQGGFISDGVVSLWNEIGPRPRHWVVVVGLVGRDFVIIDDPLSGPLRVRREKFSRWWARNENLCVLIAGPAQAGPRVGANP